MAFNNSDAVKFGDLISALAVTFGREADKPMFVGYEMALDDLPLDVIDGAVRRAMRECKFMPSGRELREFAGAIETPSESRAVIAYGAATHAVQSVGAYRSVCFDDPMTNAVIRNLGGWERFCDWPVEEVQWRKRDFEQSYGVLSQVGIAGDMAAPLLGIFDRDKTGAPEIARIKCDLPPLAAWIIRGPIPDVLVIVAEHKRIGGIVDAVAGSYQVPPVGFSSPPLIETKPLTEEEFQDRKAKMKDRLRLRIELEKLTTEELIEAGKSQ